MATKQPPVPNVPPQDAQSRFQLVFQRFLSALARPEDPLALFSRSSFRTIRDGHLVSAYALGGLASAITEGQQKTGWPRLVIGRRAHRLGIPSGEHHEQPWTAAERKFVTEHVNQEAVESIAKGLGRSEKSVRRKIEEMGLSGRNEEDYNGKRLAMDLHMRPSTIRNWINQKWLKRGRRGCIKERELATFFRNHRHELKWNELEPHIQAFILDCVRPKRTKKAAQIGAAANAGVG